MCCVCAVSESDDVTYPTERRSALAQTRAIERQTHRNVGARGKNIKRVRGHRVVVMMYAWRLACRLGASLDGVWSSVVVVATARSSLSIRYVVLTVNSRVRLFALHASANEYISIIAPTRTNNERMQHTGKKNEMPIIVGALHGASRRWHTNTNAQFLFQQLNFFTHIHLFTWRTLGTNESGTSCNPISNRHMRFQCPFQRPRTTNAAALMTARELYVVSR